MSRFTATSFLEPLASVVMLIGLSLLSLGLFIPQFGFYWDDYASIYILEAHGEDALYETFGGQARPLGGVLAVAIWEQFGIDPLPWHAINFLLYTLATILFWAILRNIWPKASVQTTLIACLFAVYPSYHLRPIGIGFHLIFSLTVMMLSFYLSLLALRSNRVWLAWLAALLIPIYASVYEQSFAYEGLRLLALFYVAWSLDSTPKISRSRLASYSRNVLPYGIPILLSALAFLLYRALLFSPNETYASYNVVDTSFNNLLLTIKLSVTAPIDILVLDWVTVPLEIFSHSSFDSDIPGLVSFFFLLGAVLYLWQFESNRIRQSFDIDWRRLIIMIGVSLAMMSVLLLPVHLVGRLLTNGFDSRWALGLTPLAALIIGLICLRFRLGTIIMLGLILLGIWVQVGNNQLYAEDWKLRQDLAEQLVFRVGDLEAGTMIVFIDESDDFAYDRFINDYELTAHFALSFPDGHYPPVIGSDELLARNIFIRGEASSGIWSQATSLREIIFRDWEYDLSKVIVVGYDGGCLRLANPNIAQQSMMSATFNGLATYQNNDVILSGENDELIAETWCQLYQNLERLLLANDETGAEQIADEMVSSSLRSQEAEDIDLVPIVEAYNRVGRFEDALPFVRQLSFSADFVQNHLCDRLSTLEIDDPTLDKQISFLKACI